MDERATIEAALAGDQAAWAALYAKHLPVAKRAASAVLRARPGEVDTVAHDGLSRALMALRSFNGGSTLATWVHKVTRNVGLDFLRRQRASLSTPLEYENDAGDTVRVDVVDPGRGPEEDSLAREALCAMDHALALLSPTKRAMVEAKYLDGQRCRETSAATGYPVGTVKSIRYRALLELRRTMSEIEDGTLPLEKRRCEECELVGRFRFADKLVDDRPLCRWCAVRPGNRPEPRVDVVDGRRVWHKTCRHCGEAFTATAAAQVYAPGHKPAPPKYAPRPKPAPPAVAVGPGASLEVAAPSSTALEVTAAQPEAMPGDEGYAVIRVSAAALDQMWRALPLADKARAFEALLN